MKIQIGTKIFEYIFYYKFLYYIYINFVYKNYFDFLYLLNILLLLLYLL